jgi:hypothetical protein
MQMMGRLLEAESGVHSICLAAVGGFGSELIVPKFEANVRKRHSKTRKTFCHEYVLETNRVVYRIRPKEEKHPAILPVGEKAMFRMKKDLMVLKVPEGDDKEREYDVVSIISVEANDASANGRTALPAPPAEKASTPTQASKTQ